MNEMELTKEEIQGVKGKGFLLNKGTREFSARVITENGILTAQQMQAVTQGAKEFGNGNIALTVRLTIEIQGIPFEKIDAFLAYMEENGLKVGGTGARVRPVVACKGTTCSNGLSDTFAIGTQVHKRFYEGYRSVTLPHKFKIAVGGCPNNCVKPDINDVGMVSVQAPRLVLDNCRGCAKCGVVERCPMDAAQLANNKIVIDRNLCISCGACVKACYFSAVQKGETEYKVYVGGRWGKKIRNGSLLSARFSQQGALDMIEKAILYFKKEGYKGERFGATIDRIGFEQVEKALLANDLLAEKEAIIGAEIRQG